MSPSWEPMDCSLPGSSVHWISQNTGIGYFFLFQGIFLTLGSNQYLLDWQADFLPLSHQGSPRLNIGSGLPRMSQVMPIILHLSGLFCPQFSMFKKTQHYYKDCKKKEIGRVGQTFPLYSLGSILQRFDTCSEQSLHFKT